MSGILEDPIDEKDKIADFWVRTAGTPKQRASKDKENPKKMLKQYAK
ncbi:hypothetical protein SAMN04487928_11068 [Butyrivibrio proteoclasticus]|uniref:Uncharacterized protein n=1 Tax=Butyrivibrio proteoclasticus TaxID=43305 RepID=A0A1I5TWN6_9FIRM|nr:hypothetical protein [Butyrivibrio proteoclasticus]SFP87429.1 hypothetical protein SAMN04487928_11068 [Butyrivibrio proteoclasticus]